MPRENHSTNLGYATREQATKKTDRIARTALKLPPPASSLHMPMQIKLATRFRACGHQPPRTISQSRFSSRPNLRGLHAAASRENPKTTVVLPQRASQLPREFVPHSLRSRPNLRGLHAAVPSVCVHILERHGLEGSRDLRCMRQNIDPSRTTGRTTDDDPDGRARHRSNSPLTTPHI